VNDFLEEENDEGQEDTTERDRQTAEMLASPELDERMGTVKTTYMEEGFGKVGKKLTYFNFINIFSFVMCFFCLYAIFITK
jgi:hypothetical protein